MMGESKGLMLFYYLGSKESHLLIIGGPEQPVEVVPLVIPEALAGGLHIKAGPLTRPAAVQIVSQYLADLRDRAGGRGLAGIVHSPKGVMAAEQGTQLAEVLLPRDVRKTDRRPQPAGNHDRSRRRTASASFRGPVARGGRLAALSARCVSADHLCPLGNDLGESQSPPLRRS